MLTLFALNYPHPELPEPTVYDAFHVSCSSSFFRHCAGSPTDSTAGQGACDQTSTSQPTAQCRDFDAIHKQQEHTTTIGEQHTIPSGATTIAFKEPLGGALECIFQPLRNSTYLCVEPGTHTQLPTATGYAKHPCLLRETN